MYRSRQAPVASSEITNESHFYQRRTLMRGLAALFLAPQTTFAEATSCTPIKFESSGKLTPYDSVIRYNNYYEFTSNKEMVIHLAKELTLRPWTISIEGEVEKPLVMDMDDLLKQFVQEERIYRLRCVEGWSMVIPWEGFSLCQLLKRAAPTSRAKYVEFVSLHRPEEMIGQRRNAEIWPYREGLRIDEAMHPLTLVVTGLYGKSLPTQNGSPLRIVVPWKYGFKSPKAITHIRLRADQPETLWMRQAPSEYGFFANVNPAVPHPRWSQTREVRIGELRKQQTLMFNGYQEQVAHLYRGMDLKKYF